MTSKASKRKRQVRPAVAITAPAGATGWWLAAIAASALFWFLAATATASRIHFVMGYSVLASGPPELEPFLASYPTWGFASLAMVVWCGLATALLRNSHPSLASTTQPSTVSATNVASAVAALLIAWLPLLLLNLLRLRGVELLPSYWEPLWLSAWSGISFAGLVQGCTATRLSLLPNWISRFSTARVAKLSGRSASMVPSHGDTDLKLVGRTGARADATRRWDLMAIATAACAAAVGWAWQSDSYYSNFLLGFNDFGHFAQRVANTAEGRGVLLESPVLPMFWDHFNPGLLLLVPLWIIFPEPHLFFVLQSVALASGAIFVWGIARQQGLGQLPALLFGLAWLAQPVLGQMNLAYTYGWHPISLAIPLLLAAIWSLTAHRPYLALALAALAMSMEEGVIVIVCLFCAVAAVASRWPLRRDSGSQREVSQPFGVSSGAWLVLAAACGLTFVLVYRLSGIAEFQTARFATLGDSTMEVLLSPILRPTAFWGSLFRWPKLYFLLSLWLPCFVPCLLRGWRPLLATGLPLLVLLVWEHRPATSLAFQYASTLLPLFWLSTIQGTQAYAAQAGSFPIDNAQAQSESSTNAGGQSRAAGAAAGALATGLILSMFVGQLPYSSPTLLDVITATYGATDAAHERRLASDDDGRWLTEQVQRIRQDGSSVLATGRLAAHVLGNSDVETVGQYLLRRPQLAALEDRLEQPIAHYRWIILDRREGFQQTPSQIAAVEAEAVQAGFRITAEGFDVIVMERSHD